MEPVTQSLLITILIAADLAVCAVVLFYFLRGRREAQRPIDTAKLGRLVDSLGHLIKESDRASRNLLDALNERHRRTAELLREMDNREGQIARVIREAERIIPGSGDSEKADRYHEVSRLADLGLTTDEIAARVRVPKGEIELILGLKR